MWQMESMALQHEESKDKKARKDYWLAPGIIVKVGMGPFTSRWG